MAKPTPYAEWLKKKGADPESQDTHLAYIQEELLSKSDAKTDLRQAMSDLLKDISREAPARKLKPLESFSGMSEFGDLELRGILFELPTNPDLAGGKDGDRQKLKDDTEKWGVIRPIGKMRISEKSLAEFRQAEASTPWLGFVRIASRVEQNEDKITLIRIDQNPPDKRKYVVAPKERSAGQPWHSVYLNKKLTPKSEPKIKSWNGWSPAELQSSKGRKLAETGSYFGFFLIKAQDGGNRHCFNFRCPSINQYANAVYCDHVPDMARSEMKKTEQKLALQTMINTLRNGFEVDVAVLQTHFPGVALKRGVLAVDVASKRIPLSWAKAVVETLRKA